MAATKKDIISTDSLWKFLPRKPFFIQDLLPLLLREYLEVVKAQLLKNLLRKIFIKNSQR